MQFSGRCVHWVLSPVVLIMRKNVWKYSIINPQVLDTCVFQMQSYTLLTTKLNPVVVSGTIDGRYHNVWLPISAWVVPGKLLNPLNIAYTLPLNQQPESSKKPPAPSARIGWCVWHIWLCTQKKNVFSTFLKVFKVKTWAFFAQYLSGKAVSTTS